MGINTWLIAVGSVGTAGMFALAFGFDRRRPARLAFVVATGLVTAAVLATILLAALGARQVLNVSSAPRC